VRVEGHSADLIETRRQGPAKSGPHLKVTHSPTSQDRFCWAGLGLLQALPSLPGAGRTRRTVRVEGPSARPRREARSEEGHTAAVSEREAVARRSAKRIRRRHRTAVLASRARR
jgi:hypothetical protein